MIASIGEEVPTVLELLVHVGEAVNDEARLGREPFGYDIVAHQMFLRRRPIFRDVSELVVIDDDKQIIVGESQRS
jgi:hypothetical protein